MGVPDIGWARRAGTLVLLAALTLAAVMAARFVAYEIEDLMRADPRLQPPEWQIAHQARQLADRVVADDYLGFRLPAHREEVVETLDFTFRRVTGADGFPVLGPWPQRADIVFLGDSLLLGEGVGLEGSFVARIDRALADKRVVNLGNPGAGPARQYRIFERYGLALQPELVVACLYLAADLENDTHFHAWLEDPSLRDYNEFRLSYNRRMDQRPQGHIGRRLERHPLYSWAQSFVEPLLWGKHRIPHRVTFDDGSVLFLKRQKVQFARAAYGGGEADLVRLIATLGRLETLVDKNGGELVVMLIPSKEELYGNGQKQAVVNASRRLQGKLLDLGLAYLDLQPVLQQVGSQRPVFFRRDIHLNDLGNEIAAAAFLQWADTRWVSRRAQMR